MMVGSMCLHGAGDTMMPAVIAILTNVVNIGASWVLSGVAIRLSDGRLANPSPIDPLEWGVQGIAAGTSIAWVVGALAVVVVLFRGVKDLRLETRRLAPEREISLRIVRVGIPSFFEGISMWMANFFVLRFIGDIAVRGAGNPQAHEGLQGSHIIAIQWEAFSFLPGFAMGTAAGALAGQYLGAGNPSLAKRSVLACTGVAVLIMGSVGVIFMLFGETLTRFISDQPDHLAMVPQLLFICGVMQVFFAISMVIRQSLRGVGDTRWTFMITTVSSYAIRLPVAWFLGVHLGMGLPGIWIGLCGEIFVRALLFGGRFFHGGWARLKV
jgi:putative MATE family efflux protein